MANALRSTLAWVGSAMLRGRHRPLFQIQSAANAIAPTLIPKSTICTLGNSAQFAKSFLRPLSPSSNVISPFPAAFAKKFTSVASEKVPVFAVVVVGGKQYKVCENDCIVTEKLIGKSVGTIFEIGFDDNSNQCYGL